MAEDGDAQKTAEGQPSVPLSKTYNPEKKTLFFGIEGSALNTSGAKAAADLHGLVPKADHHITVIGFRNGWHINQALALIPEGERAAVLDRISDLVASTDWSFSPDPRIYRIQKDYPIVDEMHKPTGKTEHRESIIQMINMPGMAVFYAGLNAVLGTKLEAPPAHTTLYTGGDDAEKSAMGIGITTEKDLLEMHPELII